jgi:hypothetical protein
MAPSSSPRESELSNAQRGSTVLRFEGRRVLSQKTHEATDVIQSGVLPEFGRTLGSMVGYDV